MYAVSSGTFDDYNLVAQEVTLETISG